MCNPRDMLGLILYSYMQGITSSIRMGKLVLQEIVSAYNVQVVSNNQIIVAMDVTQDENDQGQLVPMLEQVVCNLSLKGEDRDDDTGSYDKLLLGADAGYNRGKNLSYLDKNELFDPYISMHNRAEDKETESGLIGLQDFDFDEENERWVCPRGHFLEFMREEIRI